MSENGNISLVLSRNPPIYYVGEELKGTVNLSVKKRTKVNSIFISVLGVEKFYGGDDNWQKENCLEVNIDFLKRRYNDPHIIESGEYTFPFKLNLPDNLTSSIQDEDTDAVIKTKYTIQAILDIPWRSNISIKRFFKLMRILDLNLYDSRLAHSFNAHRSTQAYATLAYLDINFTVLKTGFVPGESIIFNVHFINKTNKSIKDIVVTLVQEFYGTGDKSEHFPLSNVPILSVPSKYSRKNKIDLAISIFANQIQPQSSVVWERGYIEVPDKAIPSANDRIIQIFYKIKLTNSLGCSLSIPIMIGTVPLFSTQEQEATYQRTGPNMNQSRINEYSEIFENSTPSLPSYEECMSGKS